MNNDCEHKWVDIEDGTYDQICVRCSLKQMQNVMPLRFLNAKEGMELGSLIAEGLSRGINNPVQHNILPRNIVKELKVR